MLAPLKDRSLIERESPAEAEHLAQLDADNLSLKNALRQARQTQKRQATLHASKSIAQANEISRLQTLLEQAHERITQLESGQAMIEMGARLLALNESNANLLEAARRAWTLDRTLCASRHECQRLACERDEALHRLGSQLTPGDFSLLTP